MRSASSEPGDERGAALVNANLRLVIAIGRQFSNRGVDTPDLIQEGNIGLIKAALRFDEGRGVQFATYAAWWIRQRMSKAVAEQARAVRIPSHVTGVLRQIARTSHDLTGKLGRTPAPVEIAERMELPVGRIEMMLELRTRPVSLDAPSVHQRDEAPLVDGLQDPRGASPHDAALTRSRMEQIRRALAKLRPRERDVVRMRFGIDSEPYTLRETAARLNLQAHQIRQLEQRAVKKLSHDLTLRSLVEG